MVHTSISALSPIQNGMLLKQKIVHTDILSEYNPFWKLQTLFQVQLCIKMEQKKKHTSLYEIK